MPAPIPPPPPQPSLTETRAAVRLLRWITVFAIVFFALYARTVDVRGFFVEYGRKNTASWMMWKIDRLDERELRRHEGGAVMWLVGSSILRESFDEDQINAALTKADSRWRVSKFGQDRGASGLSSGLLEKLPVREGDMVLHSVGMENFLARWLDRTGVPWWQVTMLTPPALWMQVEEWSPQQKLEVALAWPPRFWQFQEEAARGWLRWIEAPWQGRPKRLRRHYTLDFHTREQTLDFDPERDADPESSWYLGPDDIDMGERQFNVLGLRRMHSFCEQRSARLVLADIPPRLRYVQEYMAPEVVNRWETWRDGRDDLIRFPQIPDEDYYDMKHPNFRGRDQLSRWLVTWLLEQEGRGEIRDDEAPDGDARGGDAR